jgi:DNA/RNA-binding domain of Phe-tRNA-synthetase-like protein
VLSENPVIREWREAYQKFKTKKGARSSIEALLSRVKKGNALGTINPLVDIYNAISLRFGLPCGGEDIDTFAGTVRLTTATGTEGLCHPWHRRELATLRRRGGLQGRSGGHLPLLELA